MTELGISLIDMVGDVLQDICLQIDSHEASRSKFSNVKDLDDKTAFNNTRQPVISIPDYVRRIAQYSKCDPSIFVMALIYIDRIVQKRVGFKLHYFNIHR